MHRNSARAAVAMSFAATLALAACATGPDTSPAARAAASQACGAGGDTEACLEAYAQRFTGALLAPASDYAAPGPFKTKSIAGGPECTIFQPETLGENGTRHPIIIWGNGTGQRPATYAPLLQQWASHGFVVAAANTTNAGSSAEMLACLDYLTAEDRKPGSDYFNKLNLARVGASGHSQGGGGAIMAGRDKRIDTTIPVQPYTIGLRHERPASGMQTTPMLLLSGGGDTIARPEPNQKPVFEATPAPVFWGSLNDASHLMPMRGAAGFLAPSTAWFRWRLFDDQVAGALFRGADCGLCKSTDWVVQRKKLD